jgi:hypothetical protein
MTPPAQIPTIMNQKYKSPLISRRTLLKAQLGLAVYLTAGRLAAQGQTDVKKAKIQERKSWEFEEFSFDNKYSGARLSDVKKTPDGSFRLLVEPETKPINPSQWYAFRITSKVAKEITLEIQIDYINSRNMQMKAIPPLIKNPSRDWVRLGDDRVSKGTLFNTFKINLDKGENFFAPFEPVTLEDVDRWTDKMKSVAGVKEEIIGQSIEGRPLRALILNPKDSKKCIFIHGGQHPPEMTGNMGLFHYVEELFGDSEIAVKIRERFAIVVVPMVNPDGKFHGHWRCNLGGLDLNRDWSDFSQKEAIASRDFIRKTNNETKVEVLIDFHSVYKSCFYIEYSDAPDEIKNFTKGWMSHVEYKTRDFKMPLEIGWLDGSSSPELRNTTGKGWVSNTLSAPSYIREFGYMLSREEVKQEAVPEVIGLMKYLLSKEA